MATLAEVISTIRDLGFDRFVTPSFYLKSPIVGDKLTINSTGLTIKTALDVTVIDLPFATYTTMQSLFTALLSHERKLAISYSASFINSTLTTSLLPLTNVVLNEAVPIYRMYFFSQEKIVDIIERYFMMVLRISCREMEDFEAEDDVALLGCRSPEHLSLWCAYWLVEERRLYEIAAEALGQSTFSQDGNAALVGIRGDGGSITVQIGDVFTMQDSNVLDYTNEGRFNAVGSDNVLGDASSFWYRLQLHIRSQVERLFGDFSLRPDEVIMGRVAFEKDTNFYAWYDQYPYTISPLMRGIINSSDNS